MCLDRPEKPTNVEAVIVTSRSLSLEWVEPYHNNAPVLGYRVMYSQQDIGANVEYVTEQETLQIASLLPGITYQFTVVAYNDIGDSAPSDILEITTLEEGRNKMFSQCYLVPVLTFHLLLKALCQDPDISANWF